MLEKLIIVTRKTRLEELVERFNTRAQARFYIEHGGGGFAEYEQEHDAYRRSLDLLRRSLDVDLKVQVVDRALVPTMTFTAQDLIVTIGQDGLVANTAKYVGGQPIIAVNPDPARFDGVLLPFAPTAACEAVRCTVEGRVRVREVTLAEAELTDGQRLLAFNDLFIGAQSHVSARYRIGWEGENEAQSSSGIIISTGAGSTGWLSSVFNMAAGVASLTGGSAGSPVKLGWEDPRLVFVVREPFVSKHSQASLVAGLVAPGQALRIESLMPIAGTIFSDGVEADYIPFNSGAVAQIRASDQRARLVVGT